MPEQFVIDDSNWQDVVDQARRKDRGVTCLPRRSRVGGMLCTVRAEAEVITIPEDLWEEMIAANDAAGCWMEDLMRRAGAETKDQDGLGYCWAYSLTSSIEAMRVAEGQDYLKLLPESLGGDVGWANRGNYLDSAIAWAAKYGICEARFSPRPNDISPSDWMAGWEENALKHKPLEWFDSGSWAEAVSLALIGFPLYVAYNWWSHAVWCGKLVVQAGVVCPRIWNSWGAWGDNGTSVITGSRRIFDECFAPRSTTWTPNAEWAQRRFDRLTKAGFQRAADETFRTYDALYKRLAAGPGGVTVA